MWKDYVVIMGVIVVGLIMVSLNNMERADGEKLSPYECGFEPYGNARQRFDITFYKVGILFIVFDLEIIFIFPYASVRDELGMLGYWVVSIFVILLTVGLIYEWQLLSNEEKE